jgi:hypothetical protein
MAKPHRPWSILEKMKAGLLIFLAFSIFNAGRAQPLSFEVASVKPALADQGVRVVAMGSIPNMPPTGYTCRRSADASSPMAA